MDPRVDAVGSGKQWSVTTALGSWEAWPGHFPSLSLRALAVKRELEGLRPQLEPLSTPHLLFLQPAPSQ